MSRSAVLSDVQWALIEPLMPSSEGKRGNRFREHRTLVEAIVYRFRTGIAWPDLPARFGPWQTVWKRHRRFSGHGTWDRIHTALLTAAAPTRSPAGSPRRSSGTPAAPRWAVPA